MDNNMIVKTGIGYITKDGKVISKYELPQGTHPILPEGCEQVEVKSQAELDLVTISEDPAVIARREARKRAIGKLQSLGFTTEEINAIL